MPDVNETYHHDPYQVYLEHYVLLKVDLINRFVLKAVEDHDWKKVITEIHNFCSNDLPMYFDARKDVLYCGQGKYTPNRAITIKMLEFLFHRLVRWLAPVIPFATEEAWQTLLSKVCAVSGTTCSVHLESFDIQEITLDMTDIEKAFDFPEFWQNIKRVRSDILKELEILRTQKKIGSSLEARLILDHSLCWKDENRWVFKDWENMAGVSQISEMRSLVSGEFNAAKIIGSVKCDRCWKINIYGSLAHPRGEKPDFLVCDRCADQLAAMGFKSDSP
jgi:isoleucyl-tRNA synthetase